MAKKPETYATAETAELLSDLIADFNRHFHLHGICEARVDTAPRDEVHIIITRPTVNNPDFKVSLEQLETVQNAINALGIAQDDITTKKMPALPQVRNFMTAAEDILKTFIRIDEEKNLVRAYSLQTTQEANTLFANTSASQGNINSGRYLHDGDFSPIFVRYINLRKQLYQSRSSQAPRTAELRALKRKLKEEPNFRF